MHRGIVHDDDDGLFMNGTAKVVIARIHDQYDTAILETFGVNATQGQFVIFKHDIVEGIEGMEDGTVVDLAFNGKLPTGPITIEATPGSPDDETEKLMKRWATRRSIKLMN